MKIITAQSSFLTLVCCLLFSTAESADYAPDLEVTLIHVRDFVEFSVSVPPGNTCSLWGYHFRFDATTPGGKNMLSILLAAKLAGKRVNVWYTPSSAPGADQTSGCNLGTAAVLTTIGLR